MDAQPDTTLPTDLAAIVSALNAADADAITLVAGLSEELGTWRQAPGSWSVAECLDHLATANRVYLAAMRAPAERARTQGSRRVRPAKPGFFGGWFVRLLEPPVKVKGKAPRAIKPRPSPALQDAMRDFLASQEDARRFVREFAAIDLAQVGFPNPFIRGVRFSLATGLHVIPAHDRRHLWQAWRVRRAAEVS